MLIGVPREMLYGETRVAATPKTVDSAFANAGAKIGSQEEVWNADIIFKVNAPTEKEIALIKEGTTLVSFIWPAQNPELMEKLQA